MRHPHPGQDQKSHVVGDEVQTGALERDGPPDMTVARGDLPGRTRPPQATDDLAIDEHHLFEVFAHEFGSAQVLVMVQQVVPKFAVRSLRRLDHRPRIVPHRPAQRLLGVERNLGVALLRNIALDALARRQLDQSRLFQAQQQVTRRELLVAPRSAAANPTAHTAFAQLKLRPRA